jgi:hypothetical protein
MHVRPLETVDICVIEDDISSVSILLGLLQGFGVILLGRYVDPMKKKKTTPSLVLQY